MATVVPFKGHLSLMNPTISLPRYVFNPWGGRGGRERRIGIKLPRNRASNGIYRFYRARSVFAINHRCKKRKGLRLATWSRWNVNYYSIRERERDIYIYIYLIFVRDWLNRIKRRELFNRLGNFHVNRSMFRYLIDWWLSAVPRLFNYQSNYN